MIHTPLLPLSGVLWISWINSHISIGPWCCDGLTWWLIWTERFLKGGCSTDDYVCSLLVFFIKWLSVLFLGLVWSRKSMPPLYFSCSSMSSVVACRLSSLLLPTLLTVCLCSIFRQKVLTGPPYIPWLWLIYPCYVDEPQDLIRTPYVRWLRLVFPFSSKIMKVFPRYPW